MRKSLLLPFVVVITAILVIVLLFLKPKPEQLEFDGDQAYQHVLNQVNFGPRTPGSQAHAETIRYITTALKKAGWEVELQETSALDHAITNIIARKGTGTHTLLVGAHYDSRIVADRDPDPELAAQPVPGANDGASGVAVLLELARVLPGRPGYRDRARFFRC